MSVWNRVGIGALALVSLWVVGKSWSSEGGDPYLKAREIEQKLLMKGGEISFADPGYLSVARELDQVPFWSADYGKAQEKLKKIQSARRLTLNDLYKLDYTPNYLKDTSLAALAPEQLDKNRPPAPPRPVQAEPNPSAPSLPQAQTGSEQPAAMTASASSDAGKSEKVAKPVVMYSTSWCGFCRRARAYFQSKGIQYIDKDVEQDPVAAREATMKTGGYGGVPVIDIDGTIIQGFDVPQIEAALARRRS